MNHSTQATHRQDLSRTTSGPPAPGRRFARFFAGYSEWLIKRNFHSLRLLDLPDPARFAGLPMVLYANHPSWWDPLVALVVWRRLLPDRTPFAPIDAAMLKKYPFFKRLGFFGVTRNSLTGARDFLRTGCNLLSRPDTLLLITPQGRFADVRDGSASFEPGLAHLANRSPHAVFLPVALEFTYWEEKRPEVLLGSGEPLFATPGEPVTALNTRLEQALHSACERLAAASIRRDTRAFHNLLSGREGTHPVYDAWRRMKAAVQGRPFTAAHGTK